MGCCSSGDSLPDVPKTIRNDPDINTSITVCVKRLGVMYGRDFSVHEGSSYPSSKASETMWLWFNKSNGTGTSGVIDLEDFNRGKKEDKNKGMVLYSATVDDRPAFEQFQRPVNQGLEMLFTAFLAPENLPRMNDDAYYLNSDAHTSKIGPGSKRLFPEMITKWRLCTRCVIRDGEKGRGSDVFGQDPIYLDVFATGTAATTWEECRVTVQDAEGRTRNEKQVNKTETEWVDRVEFQLSFRGMIWAQWMQPGDAMYSGGDMQVSSPFYDTQIVKSIFNPTQFITTTKPGVDPALALLISHVCNTEYSVQAIKKDFHPNTPDSPPPGLSWFSRPLFNLGHKGSPSTGVKFQAKWR